MFETILHYWPMAMSAAVSFVFFALYWDERTKRLAVERRFAVVVDADAEARKIVRQAKAYGQQLAAEVVAARDQAAADADRQRAEIDKLRTATLNQAKADAEKLSKDAITARDQAAADAARLRAGMESLQALYAEKRLVYERLLKEIAIFDDRLAFAEMGVYEPHFDFTDSEKFKQEIEGVRQRQKDVVSAGGAVICRTEWTVEGSRAIGKTMTNRNIKLTLRAFNGECDAAISNIRWNNAVAMEARIAKVREQLNRLNETNTITITDKYFDLKLRELRLTHEHREKLKQEKEERAELARAAREEQKLLRDLEKAQEDEAHYERLLDKAKAEAASFHGQKLEAFNEQIRALERDLAEARSKAERAQAMAEKTSSGYVYIISNVGSFGANVVKIGLTRRLDPLDRVRELGDASVPFIFDTHAIIYSDNAPALERALHAEFEAVRINTQNFRKEFFRVGLDDVEAAVKRLAPAAPFFKDIEAQEYRETLARRHAALTAQDAEEQVALPVAI